MIAFLKQRMRERLWETRISGIRFIWIVLFWWVPIALVAMVTEALAELVL